MTRLRFAWDHHIKKFLSSCTHSTAKAFETIPGPKPLPLVGNLWRYLPLIGDYKPDTLFENAQFNRRHYGPLVREQLTSNHTILHLFDPKDIETFFRQDGKCPHRRSHRALLKYRLDRPELYLDGGLFPENGPNWYRQRNQFQRRLKSKTQVASNVAKIDEVSLRTVERLEAQCVGLGGNEGSMAHIQSFESILYRWALGTTLAIFLDSDIDTLEEDFVAELTRQLHSSLAAIDKTEIQTEKWIKYPEKCPHYRALVESQDFLHRFVTQQIDVQRSKVANGQPSSQRRGASFLRDWLDVDRLDRRDVTSFIIDTLMAGLHTTAYTAAFLLYHGTTNKEIQRKLHAESRDCVPPKDKPLTIDNIDRLSFLRDCLKETLRVSPVSIGTGRVTTRDNLLIRNHVIPKDVMVITQNQTISRDDQVYADAGQFKPERWAEYRALPRELRPSPFATLPFGFGTRACIASNLAELQIKILAARLFQRFEISLDGEIPTKTTLIHNISGPVGVKLKLV